MGTQWEHWGDKGGEERNWPPLRTKVYWTTFTFTFTFTDENIFRAPYSALIMTAPLLAREKCLQAAHVKKHEQLLVN